MRWLLCCCALIVLCSLALAQTAPPPGQGGGLIPPGGPGQGGSAPPPQPPSGSAGGTAQPPAAPQERDISDDVDPFLRYATDITVRISQLELSSYPTVRAFVSVTDSTGRQIRTLKPADFSATENGKPVGNLRFAQRSALNLPLAIVFVVDISGSMESALDSEKTAVRQFIEQLAPNDRAGLITFSDAPIRQVALTTDKSAVTGQVDSMVSWGQTTLYDAIRLGMEELLADKTPARRALIVLSDGMDNKSIETPPTVLQYYEENAAAKNTGFSVYTLGLGEQIDRTGLGSISNRTGGVYLDSPTQDDLVRVYKSILEQIQGEYLLEYDATGEIQPGTIIDLQIATSAAKSSEPGKYSYRSPGLKQALARVLWPGLLTIAVLLIILIITTIYKLTRRAWLTVMLTPLEGKDYSVGNAGLEIGTLEACAVRLPQDPAILPIHARLYESADGFILEAADPNSPIVYGGAMLARKLLRSGDRFNLGYTAFVFNERVLRAGEGEIELAEYRAPVQQLTEDAQRQGVASAPRETPKALVATSGPLSGQRFTLKPGENLIGRSEGAITLNADSLVSRRHCLINLGAAGAMLTDPGSRNGTRLNGAPCQPGMAQAVFSGDVLGIGQGEYRLE